MTELLLRGKDLRENIWHYGCFIPELFYTGETFNGFPENYYNTDTNPENKTPKNVIIDDGVAWEIDIKTLSIFTGLIDKKDVKIFENDIIKIVINERVWIFVVVINPERSGLGLCGGLYAKCIYRNFKIIDDDIIMIDVYDILENEQYDNLVFGNEYEVIGNIYDNPELLSKVND